MGLGNSLQTAQAAAGGGAGVGGWVELARTTLGGTSSNIAVSSLADKRYYMVLQSLIPTGSLDASMRINNDSGSNYAMRDSRNGVADNLSPSTTSHNLSPGHSPSQPFFHLSYHSNLSANEKLHSIHSVYEETAGAGTAPRRLEVAGKWANTSVPISQFNAIAGTSTYASGSEMVVLGWDPADTHTTNFWEELASVDLSGGSADIIDSGTISAKKYLWVQAFLDGTGEIDTNFQFNSDTGSNYANRRVANGGTDATVTSQSNIHLSATLGSGSKCFQNAFIVNNSANEKLVIAHNCTADTAGAGTAPIRDEVVGKWANTSNSITSVQINNVKAGSYDTGTIMKVWGSN